MGDKGFLLTMLPEWGVQLPTSPDGSIFLTVTSNYGNYTIKGRSGNTDYVLMSAGMADITIDGLVVLYNGLEPVSAGAEMIAVRVKSGYSLKVGSGGKAYNTDVFGSGTMVVSSGGSAFDVQMQGSKGSGILGELFSEDAFLNLYGYAEAVEVKENSYIHVRSGGVLSSADQKSGLIIVSSGGVMHTGKVSGGTVGVFSGGLASNLTISSGGRLYVSSGGSALAVSSGAGAEIFVENGGYIEYI